MINAYNKAMCISNIVFQKRFLTASVTGNLKINLGTITGMGGEDANSLSYDIRMHYFLIQC